MFSEKPYVKLFCLASLVIFVIISFSCNIFIEPDPEVNNAAHPVKTIYKTAILKNYKADQVLAGVIDLHYYPEINLSLIDSMFAYVDSMRILGGNWSYWDWIYYHDDYSDNYIKTIFNFDTRKLPDGKHFISFYIYKKPVPSDSLGLNIFIPNQLYIYQTSLIFDNTPVTAPENVNVQIVNKNAQITWNATNLFNFYSYIIRRDGNIIAKINSRNTTSYTDTLPDFYKGYYEVGISNNSETAFSTKYNCIKGELLEINSVSAIDNLNDQVIFIGADNTITAVSTQTHEVINKSSNVFNGIWRKNSSNDTLYCFYDKNIYTYAVNTLYMVRNQRINNTEISNSMKVVDLACGPGDKIFLTIYNLSTSYNSLYSISKSQLNCSISSSNPVYINIAGYNLKISQDGSNFYTADMTSIEKYSYNDNTNYLSRLSSIISNISNSSNVAWNNSSIFYTRFTTGNGEMVESRDLQTFDILKTYKLPNTIFHSNDKYIKDILLTSTKLFVSYDDNTLCEFDINSGQYVRSWKFASKVLTVHGSDHGRYLFVQTEKDGRWIVDLGGAQ